MQQYLRHVYFRFWAEDVILVQLNVYVFLKNLVTALLGQTYPPVAVLQ